jgi:hypothetical protein
MTVFYLHWNEQELKERIASLKAPGLSIHPHWSTQDTPNWGENLPGIFIISLARLPSHGRQYAGWLWEAKKRQQIPIIFVDGRPDKVEATKAKFPRAVYCSSDKLVANIKKLAQEMKKKELE